MSSHHHKKHHNKDQFEISSPQGFQHLGGAQINHNQDISPIVILSPPTAKRVIKPPPRSNSFSYSSNNNSNSNNLNNNSNNNNIIYSNTNKPKVPPRTTQITHPSTNNLNSNSVVQSSNNYNQEQQQQQYSRELVIGGGVQLTTKDKEINLVMSAPRSIPSSKRGEENTILHTPPQRPVRLNQQQQKELQQAKTNAKSTIISHKLKRFFTTRPSRDSLYERHILSAPGGSSNLSFTNVLKIVTTLKKANAIQTEGLFRVNGNADTIRSYWLLLNNHESIIPIDANHHDLAGLLKLYLRESRFPLIPIELFPNSSTPTRTEDIKDFITKLPNENVRILDYIIEYLTSVSANSSVNKMAPMAIGVCFAPNMIRSISDATPTDSLTQIQNHCNLVTCMVENRQYIFGTSAAAAAAEDEIEEIKSDHENLPDISNLDINRLPLPPLPADYHYFDQPDSNLPPPPLNTIGSEEGESSWATSQLYEELTNLLIEDISYGNKDYIVNRLTNLFLTDPDNFKSFLKETLGVDGLISLLELVLTLE